MKLGSVLLLALAACAGKAPPDPDIAPDAAPSPDGPVAPTQNLSGKVMDYFGGVPLDTTMLQTDGVDPQLVTSSGADGSYMLAIPVGSKLYLTTIRDLYRQTRNVPLAVADMPVMQDLYAMSIQDVKNQYTVLGKTPTDGTAFLAAELVMPNGTPLEGIPLANVTLVDAQNAPVTGVLGPYFFGSAGSIDPALATATAYNGHSRVAFLDIPPGTYTLRVTYTDAGNTPVTSDTLFSAGGNGATITRMGAQGGGSAMPPPDPTFATDIYPRLQKAAMGGLGCANCHTANGPGAVLKFDDPADTVLTNMKAITGVIDLATPANSLVLVRPLYEMPPATQDHPNATFLDTTDPDYRLILAWITKGAKP